MAWSLSELVLYFSIIAYATETADICIWQRTEESTTFVNGLYTYNANTQDANSLGYYEKQDANCAANSLYLYFKKVTWHLGPSLGNTVNYTAICQSPTYVENPDECGNNWQFSSTDVNGSSILISDSSLQVTQGACPILNECEILKVVYWSNTHCTASLDDCCGPYDRYINHNNAPRTDNKNVYFKATLDGGRYLYFSTVDFRWICSTSINDTSNGGQCANLASSNSIDAYQLTPEWVGMISQQIHKYTWSSNQNKTAYIECATVNPTPSPTKSPIIDYTISATELALFKAEIREAFDNSGASKPLLASAVRLVFNDCIGPKEYIDEDEIAIYSHQSNFEYNTICDGCINYINDDFHDGLMQLAIEPLDYIYLESSNDWSEKMSTADFWTAVATVAIEYAIELSDQNSATGVSNSNSQYPFLFGRRDCTQSPMININETTPKTFVLDNYDAIVDFFASDLNFTRDEMLTLMGAHTLGTAHALYSGFNGQWTDGVYQFDNSYYTTLLADEWIQDENKLHWIKKDATGYNMLDSDILIGYDISAYINAQSQCIVNKNSASNYDTCPIRTSTKAVLESYKNNNELFLTNFKKVWMKLITIGYNDGELRQLNSDGTTPATTDEADIGFRSSQKNIRNLITVVLIATYCATFIN